MNIEAAYHYLYLSVLIWFAVLIGIMVIRSVIGPRIPDRILCTNMIGTMVICSIAVLSGFLQEGFLLDVALIYAMISFVTVLMLANMYIPAESDRSKVKEKRPGQSAADRYTAGTGRRERSSGKRRKKT